MQPEPRHRARGQLEIADGLWAKFMGLMGRPSLAAGAGLWLPESNGIHMMFMRFPIDAVFVGRPDGDDGARPVLSVHERCRPGRASSRSSAAPTACWSCRSGTIARAGTAVGDLTARWREPPAVGPALRCPRGSPVRPT